MTDKPEMSPGIKAALDFIEADAAIPLEEKIDRHYRDMYEFFQERAHVWKPTKSLWYGLARFQPGRQR